MDPGSEKEAVLRPDGVKGGPEVDPVADEVVTESRRSFPLCPGDQRSQNVRNFQFFLFNKFYIIKYNIIYNIINSILEGMGCVNN